MSDTILRQGSLVLYKNRPARVTRVGDKIEIELPDRENVRVRPKDITLLHPGPMPEWDTLQGQSPEGEVQTAWEILAGRTTDVAELAELVYGVYSPVTAWAAWELVADGLHFRGEPQEIEVRTAEDVAQERARRKARASREQARAAFLERVQSGELLPKDGRYLKRVEAVALGKRKKSRLLRDLGRSERPENAHALLLELNYWDPTVNPYPQRMELTTDPPTASLPELVDEPRLDLTHLDALAIDDAGTQDPDDALSFDGDRIWVHVADVAALVQPESEADMKARARGANLYLPEGTITMLPGQVTRTLGLGLADVSPALSFGMEVNGSGEILDLDIQPSWVRVQRISYQEADAQLQEAPLRQLYQLAEIFRQRRRENKAISIHLPEVKINVIDDEIMIRPLPPLKSRSLVQESMLMAGEASARFAMERDIPFPFATQSAPQAYELQEGMAGMYALRRMMKRSQIKSVPAPHAGLGMPVYTQATSPLRRYLDLVVHLQLRAYLRGRELLTPQEMQERVGAAEAVRGNVRRAERMSRRHWTLVYLLRRPEWRGEGILVDIRDRVGTVIIPELALEIRMPISGYPDLNDVMSLVLSGIDLPELEAYFRVEK